VGTVAAAAAVVVPPEAGGAGPPYWAAANAGRRNRARNFVNMSKSCRRESQGKELR